MNQHQCEHLEVTHRLYQMTKKLTNTLPYMYELNKNKNKNSWYLNPELKSIGCKSWRVRSTSHNIPIYLTHAGFFQVV